jgi:transcriptional regulator with XRE-family HTH domain
MTPMSAFSEQLRVSLDAAEMSQSDLADLSKISQPTISRYVKGEVNPEPEQFGALLDSLPDTLHFELIVARLSDELPAKYRSTVNILAHGSNPVLEDQSPYMPKNIAKDLRGALQYLTAAAIQEPVVRDLLLGLARALGANQADFGNQAKRDRKSL